MSEPMKIFSSRTLLAVRRERKLVELSIVPITTLLCPTLNYARYLLKGGVIRRAIAQSIIAAHLDATMHDEHERTRQRIEKTHGLIQNVLSTLGTILSSITTAARQIIKTINTRNTDGLDITGPRTPECRDQPTCNRTPEPTNRQIKHHRTAMTSEPTPLFSISQTNCGKSHQRYRACRNRRINGSAQNRRDCIV